MDNVILTEAFKELKLLDEEAFDINSSEEIEDAKDFIMNDSSDEVVEIADVYAEEEDEVLDSYMGKVILECNVCHSKIFEDADKINIDEDEESINVEEECPYCFSSDGYKIIGQVAPFGQVEEEIKAEEEIPEEEPVEEPVEEVEETEEEIVEESLDEGCKCEGKDCMKKGDCKNDALEECDKVVMEEACPKCGKHPCECEEELTEAYVISTWGQTDEDPKEFAREYNLRIEKISHYLDETAYKFSGNREDLEKAKADGYFYSDDEEILEEDFKDVSITTDETHMEMTSDEDGKVTVTTEPIHDDFEEEEEVEEIIEDEVHDEAEDEMIAPVDDETVAEIKGEVEEEVPEFEDGEDIEDIDIEEFDEEGFDELGESYLKKVYENVESFKTTRAREINNKLQLEGIIEFKSGSKKKTSFLFEAKDINNVGKIRFIGENKEITRGKKSFMVTGIVDGKKFMCESFNYNYRAKDENGNSTRLYGTVKRNK